MASAVEPSSVTVTMMTTSPAVSDAVHVAIDWSIGSKRPDSSSKACGVGVLVVDELTMVVDHGSLRPMETMAISKFKATCLAVLQHVRTTGQPVRITRRGEPIADVVPPGPPERSESWLGAMAGRARITGDITTPSSELVPWDVEEE